MDGEFSARTCTSDVSVKVSVLVLCAVGNNGRTVHSGILAAHCGRKEITSSSSLSLDMLCIAGLEYTCGDNGLNVRILLDPLSDDAG